MTTIRPEQPADLEAVRRVNREAFGQDDEGRLVDALRARGAVLLSMVAVVENDIVGHILFSPATAGDRSGAALGPMAVAPAHQRRGVGSRLVERGLAVLEAQRCPFVVVVRHPGFYPRFGFEPAGAYGLTCDWELPADVFMVRVMGRGTVERPAGHVAYQPEFAAVT